MSVDIAQRVHNHNFGLDAIVRSLLDTDFYKILMHQLIEGLHPSVHARFALINRTRSVRLAEVVDERELREQLDHARTLRFSPRELVWLRGNTFYGTKGIFAPEFMDRLADFRLPEYDLRVEDGQFVLEFGGTWAEASAWEIPALSILNELRSRAAMARMSRIELDILYARAKSKLWDKMERLRALKARFPGELLVSEFGTRRRHGFLWQRQAIEMAKEALGDAFVGTSNVKHAEELGLEAIGTNAHELPMVYAALAGTPEAMIDSSYRVLEDWKRFYGGNLLVFLPDAHGTTSFLKRAPDWVADWKGIRPDSKEPVEGVYEYVNWLRMRGRDPMEHVAILSDGMDVPKIEECVARFHGKIKAVPIGWGTNLTNDFVGCSPLGDDGPFRPMSLVCKVVEADGRPCVKLSDNPSKATGPKAEVARYLEVFGTEGMTEIPVIV